VAVSVAVAEPGCVPVGEPTCPLPDVRQTSTTRMVRAKGPDVVPEHRGGGADERLGPWDTVEAVELPTLNWVDWFHHERVFAGPGYRPPAKYEDLYHRQQRQPPSSTEVVGRCHRTL